MTTLLDHATLTVEVGPAIEAGSLLLFPLFVSTPAAAAYLCGPEADAAGAFHVGELAEGATVPELLVTSAAPLPLLLLEGEMLLGMCQNRTLNVSVLCPPLAATKIPVSCVEAGRWGSAKHASRSAHHAPSRLRAHKTRSVSESLRIEGSRYSDQGGVWESVAAYADALAVPAPPTSALEDVAEAAMADVAALVAGLRPLDGQCGVLAAAGDLLTLDLFDKPETLAAYWDALVAGYALDAVGAAAPEVGVDDANAMVARILAAPATPAPAVGLGTECHLGADEGITGAALVWDGAVVHLAAFDGPTAGRRGGGQRLVCG